MPSAATVAKWTLLAALLGVLGANSRYYHPFVSDDALISLRYARRLAAGLGLTWTDGERVEGYTNLLWVLLAAAPAKLGANPLSFARLLDFMGAALAIGCASLSPVPLRLGTARLSSGALLLASSAPLAIWAVGALEHGFMCGVLAVGLLLLARAVEKSSGPRSFLVAGLPYGALVLLRADGIVLFASALAGLGLALFRAPGAWQRLALWSAPPVLLVLAQLAFRLGYYGELVPNTALAKVSLNSDRVWSGLRHVGSGLAPIWPVLLLIVPAVAVAFWRGPRSMLWVPLALLVGWCAYLIVVGGDIFPGYRQLLLGLVPLAMLLSEAAARLAAGVRWQVALPLSIPLFVALGYSAWLQRHEAENVRAKEELWEWDGHGLGRTLSAAFGSRRPLLAVDAAGALPYWSNLPALDMLGLCDRHIARHRPPDFGHGKIGHELGDGAYVLGRRPDIIAFNGASGARDPMFRSGRELVLRAEFQHEYQLVRVEPHTGNRTLGELFVRREGGKLGMERSHDRICVPGLFFASADGPAAELDGSNHLVVPVTPQSPGVLDPLPLSAGVWAVETDPPGLVVGFRCPGVSAVRDSLEVTVPSIRLATSTSLRITIAPKANGERPVALRSVTLSRTTGAARHRCDEEFPPGASLADLLSVPPDGSHWAAPWNVVLSNAGVVVELGSLARPTGVAISIDANDEYSIDFVSYGTVVGTHSVGPIPNKSGMTLRELALDPAIARAGVDTLRIVPRGGDGRYSIGHLRLSR